MTDRQPEATLREWLAFAHAVADEADTIALEHFRREIAVSRKPDRTFVTVADQAIERAIRARIAAAYPDHGIVGEEYGAEAGAGHVHWYVDPIDATHNFMRGIPVFATLLAIEVDGELQLGLMSAPAMGERWWAARGLGAWARDRRGDRPMRVSAVDTLAEGQLFYGGASATTRSEPMPGFGGLLESAWRARGFGDFWGYGLVADGAGEAMVEAGMSPYDIAAPLVIVEEAGGRATDLEGRRTIHSETFVATNGLLHDEILRRLREG